MKPVSLLYVVALLFVVSCGDKYDNKRNDIQRQEAMEMIKDSEDIEIKRGWGDDKIILKDQ